MDIETTGGATQRESITEVAIVEVSESGVREWSSLVKPEGRIPESIQRLTGISNEMLETAPAFADIADEIYDRLEGRLFVAHNARFDHGHLRAAFRRAGMDWRPRVLCTVRLSRQLWPEQRRHSLDHLISRHGLQVQSRHRALGDASLLLQFWQKVCEQFPPGRVQEVVNELVGRPALPPQLDPQVIDQIPDSPGVYLFFGDTSLPVYIGKSLRLRSRVLSHFSADHFSDRELRISQQVRRIEWQTTGGELGALLREAELIKQMQPTLNRRLRRNRDLCAWRLETDLVGDRQLRLVKAAELGFVEDEQVFGFFRSRRAALERLRTVAREHVLCPPLLGLEQAAGAGRCFNHQLKRCRGGCLGHETPQAHTARLLEALTELTVEGWAFDGPVGVQEGQDIHVIDRWRYFGCAHDLDSARQTLAQTQPIFDLDVYHILVRAVKTACLIDLRTGKTLSAT